MLTISITTGTLDTESIEKLKLISFNSSLTGELRVAALQQLAVLLSDASLHASFDSLHDTLLAMLCGKGTMNCRLMSMVAVYQTLKAITIFFTDMDVRSGMVLPVLRCMRHIVHHNPTVRQSLAANTELYASLLRLIGTWLTLRNSVVNTP